MNLPTRSLRPARGALLAAGLAFALASCGDGEPTAAPDEDITEPTVADDPAPAAADVVEIERSRFAPLELAVDAGSTVTFRNLDPYAHTVTASDGSPLAYDSGSFGQDETFEQRFDDEGTYEYFCEIHPTMRATIVVS